MRPETADFIQHARSILERGRLMLGIPLYEDAGRAAYMAVFHAAQALIFEREHKTIKTHHGVQSEFHRLVRADPAIHPSLPAFLSSAYRLKSIADYELGHIHPPPEDVVSAFDTAQRFIDEVARITAHPTR